MNDIEAVRRTVNDLRASYRDTLERFFGENAVSMIDTCRKTATGLGVYVEAGATYAEATLIVAQASAHIIDTASKDNVFLRAALTLQPMILPALAAALTYFIVTPEEITG